MSVGRTTARAAVWAFASTAGAKLITLGSLSVLAHILSPTEFGMLAFAMVYITYAETIGDLGSGMALVYWPDRREDAAQVTFIVNAVAGALWCIVTVVGAPAIALFFHAPHGVPIVRALAATFVIRYLGNAHDALAQKDLRFRARAVPEVGLAAVKAVVAITLAYAGFGAWSLVWGQIAGLICWTVSLWMVVPWRPSLRLPRDLFRPMLSYGRGIIFVNVLAAVVNNADLLVVGRYLGATVLGLYQMAEKVPEASIVVVLWVVAKVLFPAFAKLHAAGEKLRTPYLTATKYVSALTVPTAIGLSVLAGPLVFVFFGQRWMGATPILRVFAIYAGIRSISTLAGDLFKATGRAQLLARLAVIKAVLVVIALFLTVRHSAVAVIAGLTIVTLISCTIDLTVASRIIHANRAAMIGAFSSSVYAGALMGGMLVGWLWAARTFPPVMQLAGGLAIGGLTYVAAIRTIDRSLYRSILEKVTNR